MESIDFRSIVERLPLVVYVDELDEHSSARYVSPTIERLLGYSVEEWLADPDLFVSRIHTDDRERVLAEIAARNDGGASDHSDYRLRHRNGTIVWVRDEEVVVAGTDGRPSHAEGYLQDVTQRRHDRERVELLARILELGADDLSPAELIRAAAELLASAVGDVTVTYVEVDPDGGIVPRFSTSQKPLPPVLPMIPAALAPLEHGPLVLDDVLLEPWLEPAWPTLALRGVRTAVDVPVRRDGRLAGILWFNAGEPRRWTAAEVQTLTELTAQFGITLERAEARAERDRADVDLRRRDAMLGAVTFGAERLLAHPTWAEAAPELLERLGRALEASRAYIFENRIDEHGDVRSSQRFEWCADGVAAELANPILQNMRFADVGLERIVATSLRNEIFGGRVRDLPLQERAVYEAQDIRSVLSVPVFVGDEWWGMIGFDDCVAEREWTAAETDTLRTAASLVAAAISRERAEAVLREHEQKLRAVFDSALDAIFITNDKREYVDVNPAACELLGVAKRDLIGRRIDDFLPAGRLATIEEDWSLFRTRDAVVEEWETLRADGEIRQVEASARPGFLPGLHIAFLRDITERKRLE
ncbi:MAG: PAS domain S-box protein, partial [Actinobacteria bacterium]|nr:PAS domain S-box protein [Actinomycetota bacterium]